MHHCQAALLLPLLVLEWISACTAAPIIDETRSAVALQRRAEVDVWKDKYFLPAIVASGVFVGLALICCYWLGLCFNSRRMDKYYSRRAYPGTPATNTNTRSPVNLNIDGAELDKEIARRASTVQRKPTPSSTHGSVPGSPRSTFTTQTPPPGAQYPQGATNNWQFGYTDSAQRPSMVAPISHGFQPAVVPSIMSVQHLNPTVASYRGQQFYQPPAPSTTMQAPGHHHQTQFRPDVLRASTVSSADSSTQIGSAAGEQVPQLYSPHQGNTLSYASTAHGMQWMSDTQNMSNPPPAPPLPLQDGSPRPEPHIPPPPSETTTSSSPTRPPAYIDNGSGYPDNKKSQSRKKEW